MRKVTLVDLSTSKLVVDLILRQGLPPLELRENTEIYNNGSNSTSVQQDTIYTADMQKCISKNQGTSGSNNYSVCRNIKTSTLLEKPLAVFSGIVNEVAVSNTYFAVGGANPFLYVFDWATMALQSASTTGLGTINCIKFSPNGSLMAVSHATSPYIRIYKTSDWSYVEPSTAENASVCHVIEFSGDGTKLVARSGTNPSFRAFNTTTAARVFSQHLASHLTDTNSTRFHLYPHPKKPNLIFSLGHNSTHVVPKSYIFDSTALTLVDINSLPSSNYAIAKIFSIYFNDLDNSVTLTHSASQMNYLSRFNVYTYEPIAIPELEGLYKYYAAQYKYFSNLCKYDTGQITGVVRDINNLPARRMVRAYLRSNGVLMAQTFSDATTGQYKLLLPDTGFYDVQFLTENGEQLNDLFFAKSIPEQV